MQAISRASSNPLLLDGLRILAVDDEEDSLFLLQFILETQGAIVTSALSVQAALKALREHRLDALVSDIAMPGEGGLELIQKVRSLDSTEGGAIPAIALTALDPELCAAECFAARFQSYVAKPVEPEVLVATIRDIVSLPAQQQQQRPIQSQIVDGLIHLASPLLSSGHR